MDAENRSVCPAQVSTTGYLFIYIRRTRISLFLPHRFVRTHDTILLLIIELNNNRPFVKKLFKVGFLCFFVAGTKIVFILGRSSWAIGEPSFSFICSSPFPPISRISKESQHSLNSISTIYSRRIFGRILFFFGRIKWRKKKKKWKHISATNLIFPAMTFAVYQFQFPLPPTISLPPIKKDEIIFWSKESLSIRACNIVPQHCSDVIVNLQPPPSPEIESCRPHTPTKRSSNALIPWNIYVNDRKRVRDEIFRNFRRIRGEQNREEGEGSILGKIQGEKFSLERK